MQKKIFLIFGLLFVIFNLLFIASPVFAHEDCEPGGLMKYVSEECACQGKCQLIDFLKLARGFSLLLTQIVGVAALIFFIVGGIIWISSEGNPEKVKKGRGILIGSLIGILIVFLAWHIINLIICGLSEGKIIHACEIFGKKWFVFPE